MASAAVESSTPVAEARAEFTPPRVLRCVWIAFGLLILAEAVHELFEIGAYSVLLDEWIPDAGVLFAACVCLARPLYTARGRRPWLAFGVGLACWSAGSLLWSALYGSNPNPRYP